jgi:hypothetical protein
MRGDGKLWYSGRTWILPSTTEMAQENRSDGRRGSSRSLRPDWPLMTQMKPHPFKGQIIYPIRILPNRGGCINR